MVRGHSPGLPIPDDWDGQSWCRYAICWPDSLQWRAILAGFITTPMLGRTWDRDTGTITDAQAIGQSIFERNLDWRYALVASCDDGTILADAIRYLADKLSSQACCNSPGTYGGTGTGGTGTTAESPIPDYDPEGNPPEGYETWDAYYTDVCKKAWWLVNTVNDDLGRMGTLQLIGATVLAVLPGLGVLLLDPIPGDELFLLAALLIAIANYGASLLDDMRDSWYGARGDIACAIYSSLGPEAAKAAAIEAFMTAYEAETTDPLALAYAEQLAGYLLSWDGLNRVYEYQSGMVYPAGETDCTECDELPCQMQLVVTYGDVQITQSGAETYEFTITSELNAGFQEVSFELPADCGLMYRDVDQLSGPNILDNALAGFQGYTMNDLYISGNPISLATLCGWRAIRVVRHYVDGTTPWSAKLYVEGCIDQNCSNRPAC